MMDKIQLRVNTCCASLYVSIQQHALCYKLFFSMQSLWLALRQFVHTFYGTVNKPVITGSLLILGCSPSFRTLETKRYILFFYIVYFLLVMYCMIYGSY